MSMYKNLTTICAVAALALGLAACGGGGGSDNQTMMCPEGQVGTYPDCSDPPPDPTIAQRAAISTAIATATTAVNAVDNDSTDADVSAADMAIANARTAIADAANVPADEKAANTGTVNALATQLSGAKTARQMAMDDAEDAANTAKRIMAGRLSSGIGRNPLNTDTTTASFRSAGYGDTNASPPQDANDIVVTYDHDANTTTDALMISLTEDKSATVADNHGWAGKRYTRTMPASAGTYEAIVYSNVEAPKMGKKFGSAAAVTPTGAYQYQLTDGALPSAQFMAANVAFTGVTRTAGTETFKLPSPNPSGATAILIPGSYHGVSGTYNCTPATPADGCSAAVAEKGFTVSAGDTWTFTPGDAMARVRDTADTAYASYGWWLHKSADGRTFTASAFTDEKGTVANASDINALNGTATYVGGAAGKYSLFSLTGGTNDAGHFTARATLEADFTNNTDAMAITGTIDQFIGADGESRNWTVDLMGSPITDTGGIGDSDTTSGTQWTIDGVAASASGQWSGNLRNNGTDGVPQVATGTFHSWYANTGRMVGGFGANKE